MTPVTPRFFVDVDDPPSKQGILQAALALFVAHGVAGTNIRMIGARAGYTNPAMFKFFETKDALAVYLFERCYDRLYRAVERAARRGPFEQALAGILDAFIEAMDDDLEAVVFVQDSLRELWPRLPPAARKRSILRIVRRVFDDGLARGEVAGFASSDVPVAAIVGITAQLARMLYFGEVEGPARRLRGELDRGLKRLIGG